MKLLKVTMVEFYEIGATMEANGWTEEQVLKDWFSPMRINNSHVSREASRIGGSRVLVNTEVVGPEEAIQ